MILQKQSTRELDMTNTLFEAMNANTPSDEERLRELTPAEAQDREDVLAGAEALRNETNLFLGAKAVAGEVSIYHIPQQKE